MNSKGVTLIELVVVLAIFILIFGAATAILLSIIQHERAILVQNQALNELSYMEEYVTKALRMAKFAVSPEDLECMSSNAGYAYLLTRYDNTSQKFSGIKFINSSENDTCTEFFLDTNESPRPILKVLKSNAPLSQAVSLSSDNLDIQSISFALNGKDGEFFLLENCANDITACGVGSGNNVQPMVTMLLHYTFEADLQESRFLQTTVSKMSANK